MWLDLDHYILYFAASFNFANNKFFLFKFYSFINHRTGCPKNYDELYILDSVGILVLMQKFLEILLGVSCAWSTCIGRIYLASVCGGVTLK